MLWSVWQGVRDARCDTEGDACDERWTVGSWRWTMTREMCKVCVMKCVWWSVCDALKCLTCVKLNLCSSPKVYSTSNLIHNANLLSSTILFVWEGFPGKCNQFPEDSEACSTIHTMTIHVFDQLQVWSWLIHNSRRKSWTFKTIT